MNILAVFERAEDAHLYKDVFQFPLSLARANNADLTFLTSNDLSLNNMRGFESIRVIKVRKARIKRLYIDAFLFVRRNAKKSDVLVLFHVRYYTLLLAHLYLKVNKKGKVIFKADLGEKSVEYNGFPASSGFRRELENRLLLSLKPSRFLISFETQRAQRLATRQFENVNAVVTYNGHSIDERASALPFLKKKNRFVSVGRIGTSVKNHDLIISAIGILLAGSFSSLIRSWDFFFVGPVSKKFHERVIELSEHDDFYKENVNIVGEVKDKSTLYQYYNESKYMILPSLREGSPLVVPEALRMGNVVITTPVSSVGELVTDSGVVLDDFTPETLSEAIIDCIQHAESEHFSELSDIPN